MSVTPRTPWRPSRPRAVRRGAALAAIASLAAGLTAAVAGPAYASTTTLYVSPSGAGSQCSAAQPCSLAEAKTTVRTINSSMSGDIIVQLADGVYRQAAPLAFSAADSGSNGHVVSWQAAPQARPVLSGARRITGWTPADQAKNIWQASVGAGIDTRQLYVDGILATRARTQLNRSDFTVTSTGLTFGNSALGYLNTLANQNRIEVHALNTWTDRYAPVQSIGGNRITMQQPAWDNNTWGYDTIQNPYRQGPLFLENAYEFLDTGGEWYLNTGTGILYYKPLPGQNMADVVVELPRLDSLVQIGGTYDAPAHHLAFTGITLTGTSWLLPSSNQGYADQQTGAFLQGSWTRPGDAISSCQSGCKLFEATRPHWHQMPAAVQVSAANHISFTRDRFVNLGQTALGLGNDANAHATGVGLGASSISVVGSVFTQDAAGAIVAGGVQADAHHPGDPRMVNKDITISNNLVHDVAIDYRDNTSFLPTYVTNATLSHNEVYNMPYTGMSLGFGWGANDVGGSTEYRRRGLYDYQPVYQTPTTAVNRMLDNYIHDVMQQMADGSCIYTLSTDSGAAITGNNCVNTNGWHGLYFDEGSRQYTASTNVFASISDWSINYGGSGDGTGPVTVTNNWSTTSSGSVTRTVFLAFG